MGVIVSRGEIVDVTGTDDLALRSGKVKKTEARNVHWQGKASVMEMR